MRLESLESQQVGLNEQLMPHDELLGSDLT